MIDKGNLLVLTSRVIYLFIYLREKDRDSNREQERGESEKQGREPDVGLDPRTLGS